MFGVMPLFFKIPFNSPKDPLQSSIGVVLNKSSFVVNIVELLIKSLTPILKLGPFNLKGGGDGIT